MTRKQALKIAIKYLQNEYIASKNVEICKVISILEELQNGIPGKIWDDKSIHAAIKRFIQENGRPPKVKELGSVKYLPPHPVIKLQYGMTAGEWLRSNYPSDTYTDFRSRYAGWTEETFKEAFISEYEKLHPTSQVQYDLERDRTTPTTGYLMKRLGVSKWCELIDKYQLPRYRKEREQAKPCIVKRHLNIK